MKNQDIKPIFIFSLPRAGSTLLQRILASNEQVASTAEPWFLLPFFYSMREKGIYTEYAHFGAYFALQDFLKELPDARSDYLAAINLMAKTLYKKVADNNKDIEFFLDKTPRYHLIVDDIIETFPEAKFIFLWRNPLAIASSITNTWDGNYWTIYKYNIDLYQGINNLVESFEKHKEKVFSIKYEELITNPEGKVLEICEYIGLKYNKKMVLDISKTKFKGEMGDPTGTNSYNAVDLAPLNKWKKTICNPYRKKWCNKYIYWIGDKKLKTMGYDIDELLNDIQSIRVTRKFLIGDLISVAYGFAYRIFELRVFRDKFKNFIAKNGVNFHG